MASQSRPPGRRCSSSGRLQTPGRTAVRERTTGARSERNCRNWSPLTPLVDSERALRLPPDPEPERRSSRVSPSNRSHVNQSFGWGAIYTKELMPGRLAGPPAPVVAGRDRGNARKGPGRPPLAALLQRDHHRLVIAEIVGLDRGDETLWIGWIECEAADNRRVAAILLRPRLAEPGELLRIASVGVHGPVLQRLGVRADAAREDDSPAGGHAECELVVVRE